MEKTSINFKCPSYYDLDMTCRAHGWKNLAPFSWNDDTRTLFFAVLCENNPLGVSVYQNRKSLDVEIASHNTLKKTDLSQTEAMIRRSLGLDLDISPVLKAAEKAGPEYVRLMKKGAGRLLRSPTFWEDAAKTLFTTNCTWSLTQKMCRAVCSSTFTEPAPSGMHPFPHPGRFARYSAKKLKAMLPIGYRADYFKELCDRFSKDPNMGGLEVNGYDYHHADQIVRRSKGFADYACSQLLVFAGYFHEIPVDTTVVAFLKRNHPRVRKPKSFIDRRYRKWGPYKWWGYKFDTMLARQNWIGD
ncbi:MAG TPA: hypothetical protein HPQ03_01130 [Deltaproteobacteria bacterium]|nr:hypothetical protein [Deltaproteobacteria bacterium]